VGGGALAASELLAPLQWKLRDAVVRWAPTSVPAMRGLGLAVIALDARTVAQLGDPAKTDYALALTAAVERLERAGAAAIALEPELGAMAGDVMEEHPLVVAPVRSEAPDADGVWRRMRFDPNAPGPLTARLLSLAGWPVELRTEQLIDWRRVTPPVPVYSLVDLHSDGFDARGIADRAVLVTRTHAAEPVATPLGLRPGIERQVAAFRTLTAALARDDVPRVPGRASEIAALLLLSLLAGACGVARPWIRRTGHALLALAVPLSAGATLLWGGLLVDPLLPLAVLSAHAVVWSRPVRRRVLYPARECDVVLDALHRADPVAPRLALGRDGCALEQSLGELAKLLDARAVELLRTSSRGEFTGERLQWPADRAYIGCIDAATLALADRSTRVFQGELPGRDQPGGLAVYHPLFAAERATGMLVLEFSSGRSLQPTQLSLIGTAARWLALALDSMQDLAALRAQHRATLGVFGSAVETRDGHDPDHCSRLAMLSGLVAERLGVAQDDVEAIQIGALLHDIGKLAVPSEILRKPGTLSSDERREVERHVDYGHQWLQVAELPPIALGVVRHHHERWDGTGYPDGLAGEAIPLGGRIVAIVDQWDALCGSRPYKNALPRGRVREILKKEAGVRLEPALLDVFFEILDEYGEDRFRRPGAEAGDAEASNSEPPGASGG